MTNVYSHDIMYTDRFTAVPLDCFIGVTMKKPAMPSMPGVSNMPMMPMPAPKPTKKSTKKAPTKPKKGK